MAKYIVYEQTACENCDGCGGVPEWSSDSDKPVWPCPRCQGIGYTQEPVDWLDVLKKLWHTSVMDNLRIED